MPTGEDFDEAYPPAAAQAKLDGHTKMRCTVTAQGRLTACSIVEEAPAGAGFGEAMLTLAPKYKMIPRTTDGQPVGGGTVVIPHAWHFEAPL